MAFPLLLLAASGTNALAQNADVQIDITASQNDTSQTINNPLAAVPPVPPGGEKAFALVQPPGPDYFQALFQLPYAYDSNPSLAGSGFVESSRFDPSAKLALVQVFGAFKLSAASAFDIDQYADSRSANSETWLTNIKLGLNSPIRNVVVPYVQYQPALKYNSNYSTLKSETNDLGGGIDFKQPGPHPWSVDVDLNAVHRFSLSGDSDALTIKPTFLYISGNNLWRFLFQPQFRFRWYDEQAGFSRMDKTFIVPAILEYDPDWLKFGDCNKGQNGDCVRGDIEFSVTYTHNNSNIAKNTASQLIIGPTLEIGFGRSWGNPLFGG